MVRAGLDVARRELLRMASTKNMRGIDLVHEAARRAGRYVGILADLGGPKIRIENFTNKKVMLADGQAFALDTAHDPKAGNEAVVGCAYKDLPGDVKAGNRLLLNDGLIELEVTKVAGTRIDTKVIGAASCRIAGCQFKGADLGAVACQDRKTHFRGRAALEYRSLLARDAEKNPRGLVRSRGHAICARDERPRPSAISPRSSMSRRIDGGRAVNSPEMG